MYIYIFIIKRGIRIRIGNLRTPKNSKTRLSRKTAKRHLIETEKHSQRKLQLHSHRLSHFSANRFSAQQSRGKFCKSWAASNWVNVSWNFSPLRRERSQQTKEVRIPGLCFRRTRSNTPLTQARWENNCHEPTSFQPRHVELKPRSCI